MVLHLLGKKSWNVYNEANIARVRRDETEARARREEEELQREQLESENRLRLLRAESARSLSPRAISSQDEKRDPREERRTEPRLKRRRLANEDDTDRDIRLARAETESRMERNEGKEKVWKPRTSANAPLFDKTGHLALFAEEGKIARKTKKKEEVEREKNRQLRGVGDQYGMRLSDAAGYGQSLQSPWYFSPAPGNESAEAQFPNKNVWGNEDPPRREREAARLDLNDPLAFMKRGVRQLKGVEAERRKWIDERRKELEELKAQREEDRERRKHEERRHARHSRKHGHSSRTNEADSLDNSSNLSQEKTKRSKYRDSYGHDKHSFSHRRHRDRRHSRHRSLSPRHRWERPKDC